MHHGRSFGVAALLVVSVAVPLACGGNKQDAKASFALGDNDAGGAPAPMQQPCQAGQPCPAQTCPPGQICPAPQGAAVPTSDPNALASLLAAAAAAGSAWLGPAAAIADPAEAGLRAAALKYAPGMSPDGQVAKGNLSEGGHVGFIVNMDPSKCYTIVAYGAGVTDLDVNLLAPPLYNFLAGQDGMTGPTAVIGASPKPMCPISPMTRGGGVAAQLYSRRK